MITAHNIGMYKSIIKNTIAIAFMGTPHRGADLANLLKGLLSITFSETRFIRDLSPASQAIKDINDSFGERSGGLKLASFWESTGMLPAGVSVELHRS